MFSKHKTYTHFDIQYANYLKSLGYIHTIELIQDNQSNALIYDELIDAKELFKNYNYVMLTGKEKYPKNQLFKLMASQVVGLHTEKGKLFTFSDETIENWTDEEHNKYVYYNQYTNKRGKTIYQMLDANNTYKFRFRLTPFVQSFGRKKMGNKIIKHINHVIRVNTDGVIFKKCKATENLQGGEFHVDKKYNAKIRIEHVNKIHIL